MDFSAFEKQKSLSPFLYNKIPWLSEVGKPYFEENEEKLQVKNLD